MPAELIADSMTAKLVDEFKALAFVWKNLIVFYLRLEQMEEWI